MYKVVIIKRFNDTVFRDDFKFKSRDEANTFYTEETEKDEVVRASLYYCIPYGDEKELAEFIKPKNGSVVK